MYRPARELGYEPIPGQRLTIKLGAADPLVFTVTIDRDGRRVTHPDEVSASARKPEIWIFGCSFTFGWGVDDAETYPAVLQRAMPDFEIVNFGVGGYGTLQSLMQLEREIRAGRRAALTVLAYADFHDKRNVLTPARLKTVGYQWQGWGEVGQPYVVLGPQGELIRRNSQGGYQPHVPFVTYSGLANRLDWLVIDRTRDAEEFQKARTITERLVLEFSERSRAGGMPFLLVQIAGRVPNMVEFGALQAIPTGDIRVSLAEPSARLRGDLHPNARAHEQYAARLHRLLSPMVNRALVH
jgi:hypothetical protein